MFSCVGCHEHEQAIIDPRHAGIPGYQFDSKACLMCHPSGVAGAVCAQPRLIKGQIQRLAVEAVDAKLTNRPFNQDLKRDVDMQVTMASVGSIMEDASKSMDEAVARFDQHDKEREISQAQSQANREARAVGKPTMDLGGSSSR